MEYGESNPYKKHLEVQPVSALIHYHKPGAGSLCLVIVRQTDSAGNRLAALLYGVSCNLCGTLWGSDLSLQKSVCITFTEVLLKDGDAFYMVHIG